MFPEYVYPLLCKFGKDCTKNIGVKTRKVIFWGLMTIR